MLRNKLKFLLTNAITIPVILISTAGAAHAAGCGFGADTVTTHEDQYSHGGKTSTFLDGKKGTYKIKMELHTQPNGPVPRHFDFSQGTYKWHGLNALDKYSDMHKEAHESISYSYTMPPKSPTGSFSVRIKIRNWLHVKVCEEIIAINVNQAPVNPSSHVSNGFGNNYGWNITSYPRMFADVNNDGREDIVGFASHGVMVALSNGSGFNNATTWSTDFGTNTGWTTTAHPRFVTDVNKDGRADIVGFAAHGVMVALANSTGTGFGPASTWITGFGTNAGWSTSYHPRYLRDVNGDGRPDVVGFASHGAMVALANSTGTGFNPTTTWINSFGLNSGWNVASYPRFVEDVNNDGRADIVGFSSIGVMVSLANSAGNGFDPASVWSSGFGTNHGWSVLSHPRMLRDVNGDGRLDVIGFASHGVMVALANTSGTGFGNATVWKYGFGTNEGWNVFDHPRMIEDMNGDGRADLVAFANSGVYVAYATTNNDFGVQFKYSSSFGRSEGWNELTSPRLMADVTGDGKKDILGFATNGVHMTAQ